MCSHEAFPVARAPCSPNCRRSPASPRPAAPCRRCPASRSAPSTRPPSCWPPTWRWACASRCEAEVARPGEAVVPARLLLDVVRSLPGRRGEPRAARRRAGRRDRSPAPPRFTCARCAPRTSPRCRRRREESRVTRARPGVRRHDRPGRALGLARRDAPDPHRHPRLGLRARSCAWSRRTPTA